MILTLIHEEQFAGGVKKEIEFERSLCRGRQLVPVSKDNTTPDKKKILTRSMM